MKIVTVSDLHINKDGWGSFGVDKAKEAAKTQADVLYCNGDLGEPDRKNPEQGLANFELGLQILSDFKGPKLFAFGNNDLEHDQGQSLPYYWANNPVSRLLVKYGFHILDASPFILNDVGFVGNLGWYDGSLWTPYPGETEYPNTKEAIRETAENWFHEVEFPKAPSWVKHNDLFYNCEEALSNHLESLQSNKDINKVVLGIHFVPDRQFVNGDTAKFAYLNWFMGSKYLAEHYQWYNIVLRLTGHTHRSESHQVGGKTIHNLSGENQPRVFEI